MGSEDDHRRSPNGKIMIIFFSCSFTFVLLLVLLHLYSRCLLRGHERSRRRNGILYGIHRRQSARDVENSIEPQPPKLVGLDPLVMASLPTFTYKKQIDRGHEPVECSVCLGIIVEGVMVKVLPNCKHMFHVECIDTWLGSHSTCPICRTAAEPSVQQPGERRELDIGDQPSAPPLEENMVSSSAGFDKDGESAGSRLDSFRRMLSMERSSRTQSFGDEVARGDLEER